MPPTVRVTLDIPTELHAKLRALHVDIKETALAALVAAGQGNSVMVEPQTKAEPPKKTGGRPLKGDRVNITVYVERRYVIALDALATQRGCSRADVVNSVLENAIKTGALTEPTDG